MIFVSKYRLLFDNTTVVGRGQFQVSFEVSHVLTSEQSVLRIVGLTVSTSMRYSNPPINLLQMLNLNLLLILFFIGSQTVSDLILILAIMLKPYSICKKSRTNNDTKILF